MRLCSALPEPPARRPLPSVSIPSLKYPGLYLAHHARCHYIVGNSKFYGTVLPVEEIYASLFEDAGFQAIDVQTIRKRTSKKELFEYLVSAQAP
jgi:hypothetical protein